MINMKITSSLVGSAKPGKWTSGGSPTKASPPLTRITKPFINDDHVDDNDDDDDDLDDNYNNDDDVDDNHDNDYDDEDDEGRVHLISKEYMFSIHIVKQIFSMIMVSPWEWCQNNANDA